MLDLSRVLYIETWVCLAPKRVPPVKILDFPDGAYGKACAYNAGDPVRSLGREDPLEKEMATHSRTLAWKAPRTQEPGRLQSTGRKQSDTAERLHIT